MTDFAQDQLWEEEGQEPEISKAPKDQAEDPKRAAGNAALAQAAPAVQTEQVPAAKRDATAKATVPKAKTPTPETEAQDDRGDEQTVAEELVPKPEAAPDPTLAEDWMVRLQAVTVSLQQGALDQTVPDLLTATRAAGLQQARMIGGVILSAFLRLPAGLRKLARDQLVAALTRAAAHPVAQVVLTRLGGLPAPAPPPAPPAAPGGTS